MRNFLRLKFLQTFAPSACLALFGFLAVAGQVDPGGALRNWPAGPGLSVDEGFNVEEGVRLAAGLKAWALGAVSWRDVFGQREDLGPRPPLGYHLPDHPPAGRIWLGLWHQGLSWLWDDQAVPARVVVAYARIGSAAAFGLLILLIGVAVTRWHGHFAGLVSALSLILMPRLFGHAHLASLETVTGLTYTATILAIAGWWKTSDNDPNSKPPGFRPACIAGVCWGLALLTKIQAVLLPFPVIVWALWHWRWKAIWPLFVLGAVGLLVFFLGWPWLWLDPIEHLTQYFRRTTERSTLYVWYFGERFTDKQTPWHYSFVLFLTTVPVGLLVLGVLGVLGVRSAKCGMRNGDKPGTRDARVQLILASAVFPLCVFALPGVAVYDGARLFLISFPLWAILVGRGAAVVMGQGSRVKGQEPEQASGDRQPPGVLASGGRQPPGSSISTIFLNPRLSRGTAITLISGFVLLQGAGVWLTGPCHLSYYNLLVGGLPGAARLGMELDYWGTSLTREFWDDVADHVPPGSVVHVAPVLHPFQLDFMRSQLPRLARRNVRLLPADPERLNEVAYLVVFNRRADLAPAIQEQMASAPVLVETTSQGVRLAGLYELSDALSQP